MSQSANVRSVEAIHDFKVALANFAEEARNALGSTDMEVRRARDWLQRDQLGYWQAQVKRSQEQLSMARTELHRRRLSQQGSDAISDTEQKENVRNAQRRLEEAEAKVAKIKRWVPVLDHAITEYHSSSQPLGDRLSGALVGSLSLLQRTIGTLESYAALVAPSAPSASTGPASSSAPAASGSAATGGTTATGPAMEESEAKEPPGDDGQTETREDSQPEPATGGSTP